MKIHISTIFAAIAGFSALAACSNSDAGETGDMTLIGSRLFVEDDIEVCIASYAALERGQFTLKDLEKLEAEKGDFRASEPCDTAAYSHRCVYETTIPHVAGGTILSEAQYHKLSGGFVEIQRDMCAMMGDSIPMTTTRFEQAPF